MSLAPNRCIVKGCLHTSNMMAFRGRICGACYKILESGRPDEIVGNSFIHDLYRRAMHTDILKEQVVKHYGEVLGKIDAHLGFKSSTNAVYAKRYARIRDLRAHGMCKADVISIGVDMEIYILQGDVLDKVLDSAP